MKQEILSKQTEPLLVEVEKVISTVKPSKIAGYHHKRDVTLDRAFCAIASLYARGTNVLKNHCARTVSGDLRATVERAVRWLDLPDRQPITEKPLEYDD